MIVLKKLILVVGFAIFAACSNAYQLSIKNNTCWDFKNVVVVFTPINFDANYGRFDSGPISANTEKSFEVENVFLKVPLSGLGLTSVSLDELDLRIMVITSPPDKSGRTVCCETKERILDTPKMITSDYSSNGKQLQGLLPPNVIIALTGDKQTKIDVQFE